MYKIIFSNKSLLDLNLISNIIYNYIGSEEITNKIYNKIISEIKLLKFTPYIAIKYKEYRVLTINKKYKVFYKINEKQKNIKIYRIFFSSSNYQKII